MNQMLTPQPPDAQLTEIIKLAILAVGGQGGGVLTNWIESLARSQGYACQATSVAGVAQRTGSTIYYIEMAPDKGGTPIFSLAPAEGDVDIVIAAEMMEVGRAIMRGFVTPDRTILIGSTHRALAVSEKMVPGNGMADADEVTSAAEIAAQHTILADMDHIATAQGSVISASLFGALAGSGALPFARTAFEDAIRRSGKGVEASLRAFEAGLAAAQNGGSASGGAPAKPTPRALIGPAELMTKWNELECRLTDWPENVQPVVRAGMSKVVDFQDLAYGAVYLDRLETVRGHDTAEQGWSLTRNAAKYIANAMAYDDIIRVADLKTRAPRRQRIRDEMMAGTQNLVQVTEYFHPRAEEVVSLLPAKMGERWEASPRRMAFLDKLFNKGRRLRTDALPAFLILNFLGGLKKYRLRTRRHAVETAHIETWLADSLSASDRDYALSVELLKNRRLIKGYSDTHARGVSKFARAMQAATLLEGRDDAADWMRRIREAALQDEQGTALDGAIETVRSFAG